MDLILTKEINYPFILIKPLITDIDFLLYSFSNKAVAGAKRQT